MLISELFVDIFYYLDGIEIAKLREISNEWNRFIETWSQYLPRKLIEQSIYLRDGRLIPNNLNSYHNCCINRLSYDISRPINEEKLKKIADINGKIITKMLLVYIAYNEAFLNDSSIFEKYFDCSELVIDDICRASEYIIQHPALFHLPQMRSITMFMDRTWFEKIPASTDYLLAFICDQKSYANRMKCRLHLENDGIRDFIDKFLKSFDSSLAPDKIFKSTKLDVPSVVVLSWMDTINSYGLQPIKGAYDSITYTYTRTDGWKLQMSHGSRDEHCWEFKICF